MGVTFEDLPPEILKAIVSFAEPSTWKNLRLVNKATELHATPLLFRNIEVWIQSHSLSW